MSTGLPPHDRRGELEQRRARRAAITDPEPMMEAAATFLAARPRSVEETRRRLLRLGYPEELVAEVVARLERLGYLDDRAFARAWVESRDRSRPRGAAALRHELALRGVDPGVIATTLDARASGWDGPGVGGPGGDDAPVAPSADREAARRLLIRRAEALRREPDPRRRRQRAYALLARNGFDPDVCREESRAFGDADGEDEAPADG